MYRFVAVCLLVLVGGTGAGSGQLDRLFLQGTQLHRDTLRLTLRGILPFPNEFVEHPRAAADGWRVLQEHDVTLWYMPVYVMPSLELAFEHQQRVPYPLTQGLYLINPQFAERADPQAVDFDTLIELPQTRKALYEGGEWHDGETTAEMRPDRWRFISREGFQLYLPSAAQRTNFPVQAIPSSPHFGDEPHYRVPAFTKRKVIGINHADALQDRSLRSVFNKTHTLFKQGYQVVFNEDVEHSITALRHQQRKGQSVEMNRYRDEHVADTFRAAFAAGKAFNALLLSPKEGMELESGRESRSAAEQVVAGVVGYVHNNVFSPDSVFGDNIDMVKVVDFALMRYLQAHDINFVNAGMVTPYTESIKGYRVTEQHYQALQQQLPHEPVSLPHGWQDTITVVKATKKRQRPYVEGLIAAGKITLPLLLINSDSNENPTLQKNNTRNDSLARLLTEIKSYTIFTPDNKVLEGNGSLPQDILRYFAHIHRTTPDNKVLEGNGSLPQDILRYFAHIHRIDVEQIEKISIMHVTTLSGFPVPLYPSRAE